jgi:hypothetical protein
MQLFLTFSFNRTSYISPVPGQRGKSPKRSRNENEFSENIHKHSLLMKKYTIMQLTHEVRAEVVRRKVKLSRYRHVGAKGKRYSSSFLSSALDGGEWSASRPYRAFILGKGSRYPLCRRLGGPQLVWTQEARGKILFLCRGSNLGRPACSLDTVLTELGLMWQLC